MTLEARSLYPLHRDRPLTITSTPTDCTAVRRAIRLLMVGLTLACASPLAAADETSFSDADIEFFESKIRPLLVERCFECHSAELQEGELRLDSRSTILSGGGTGPAITPGDPENSLLLEAVEYDPLGYQMPPDSKLPDAAIADLREWIRRGAPWPPEAPSTTSENDGDDWAARRDHWAFQPMTNPAQPAVSDPTWPRQPLDTFILAELDKAGLKPSAEVDRATWLRRVTYDLTGLPPSVSELQAFLDDPSPNAYERVVDRLLASPRYGERWGRHWLDLMRFSETLGHEFDYDIPFAWRYRDYVVRALNADLPYNQFAQEHIAGDLLPAPRLDPVDGTNQSVIGTAFYWMSQGKHSPVDIRAEECDTVDNQIDVLSRSFLALTVSCARCHDHKFDPITAADYYAVAGLLQSSRRDDADITNPDRLAAAIERLDTRLEQHQDTLRERASALLSAKSQRLRTLLADPDNQAASQLLKAAAENPADPLYPLAISHLRGHSQAQQQVGNTWETIRSQTEAADRASTVFEAFDERELPGWSITRSAFAPTSAETPTRFAIINGQPAPLSPGRWSSGTRAAKEQGTLRSPTFTIEKPFIDYHIARHGGRDQPGRPYKNGQVHLIVDGFQIIRSPLYGNLSLNIPKDQPIRWYRQDVRKFVGRKAYIEIVDDEPDGWIEIDEVRFSDGPQHPETPLPAVTEWWHAGHKDFASAAATFCDQVDAAVQRFGEARTERALTGWLQSLPIDVSPPAGNEAAWTTAKADITSAAADLPDPRYVPAMIDGTPENEHVLIRGNPRKLGEEIPRRFLSVFDDRPFSATSESGRRQFAEAMTSADNPLFARVIVNRLWQHHFGEGIVPSVDNFGLLGKLPTHPALLDFLAQELIRHDWSLKQMHRTMVLSATYRQSTRSSDPEAERLDPQNKLLHKARTRRLEAEAIRDALLAVSGSLDSQMEGESVLPHLTEFMQGRGRPGTSGPLDGNGRRSIYINVRRNFLTPMFLAFDFPTPMTTVGRRSVSNVPAQALTMLNNPFVLQQAERLAHRLLGERDNDAARIQYVCELLYARPPQPEEQAAIQEFLAARPDDPRAAWTDACHALLNMKEFIFIP